LFLKNKLQSAGLSLLFVTTLLTACVSALRLSFNMGYYYELHLCANPLLPNNISFVNQLRLGFSFEAESFLLITFALFLSAAGLWSRRLLGLVLSLVSLLALIGVYLLWYRATLSIIEMYGAKTFSGLRDQQQHLLSLYQASWWDIVVLGIALLVIVWEVVTLGRVLWSSKNVKHKIVTQGPSKMTE